MTERPSEDSAILRGGLLKLTFRLNVRLKGYVLREWLSYNFAARSFQNKKETS